MWMGNRSTGRDNLSAATSWRAAQEKCHQRGGGGPAETVKCEKQGNNQEVPSLSQPQEGANPAHSFAPDLGFPG